MPTTAVRRMLKCMRGNATLITALCAIPLFGVAGIAIDTFRHQQAQAQLQAALDAGALAGAATVNASEQDIRQIIEQFADTNGINDIIGSKPVLTITFNDNGSIRVRAEGKIRTTLGNVLGVDRMNIAAETEVMAGKGGAEVALVVDTTGSMGQGGKMAALKDAAKTFIDIVEYTNKQGYERIFVSIVPYAARVNVGKNNRQASWLGTVDSSGGKVWEGCVGFRDAPNDIRDSSYGDRIPPVYRRSQSNYICPEAIEPLTANPQKLRQKVNSLYPGGHTYIPGGLIWGWRTLSSMEPFSEGADPTEAEQKRIRKYIVVMTDGVNTMRKRYGDADLEVSGNPSVANARTLDVCENVKADGIDIFSIAFQVNDSTTQNMLRNCASDPSNYYDASDPAQLSAAFRSIGSKVASVRLSK